MVRHTLKSLGPKVLATRMVRDYVRHLYVPAAGNAHSLNADYAGAATLAAWKKKVRSNWPSVRVEHVESNGVGEAAEVGNVLHIRAFVCLGDLTPDDVHVQVADGKIDSNDLLTDTSITDLALVETYEGGRFRFDGEVTLDRSGPFGYTVRVIPRNDLLTSAAEMGFVALA
jgi:starch phosphorylase